MQKAVVVQHNGHVTAKIRAAGGYHPSEILAARTTTKAAVRRCLCVCVNGEKSVVFPVMSERVGVAVFPGKLGGCGVHVSFMVHICLGNVLRHLIMMALFLDVLERNRTTPRLLVIVKGVVHRIYIKLF